MLTPDNYKKSLEALEDSISSAKNVLVKATPSNKSPLEVFGHHVKDVVNACVQPVGIAAKLLQGVGGPCAALGVTLEAVIDQNKKRAVNESKIAALFFDLSLFLQRLSNVLVHLAPEQLERQRDLLEEVGEVAKDLGGFSQRYHSDSKVIAICKQFVLAETYQSKLDDFLGKINNFDRKLNVAYEKKVLDALAERREVVKVYISLATDVEKHKTAKKDREPSADDLEALARRFGVDKKELQEAADQVKANAEELRSNRYPMFEIMLEFSRSQILQQVKFWGEMIQAELDKGPYNLLQDQDMKEIWKATAGRQSSVARRHFLDGMSFYFQRKFKTDEKFKYAPDAWTLGVISKVYYHPAIGDAVDKDSSGFISVDELVDFMQEMPPKDLGWTVPERLAYAAYGWDAENYLYQTRILELFQNINQHGSKDSPATKVARHTYLEAIRGDFSLIMGSLYEIFDDLPPEAVAPMEKLRSTWQYTLWNDAVTRLRKVQYSFNASAVAALSGSNRIELTFFLLLNIIFTHHKREFDEGIMNPSNVTVAIGAVRAVFQAFDQRVLDMKRIWRRQDVDVDRQMRYFANGMFQRYYESQKKPRPNALVPQQSTYAASTRANDDGNTLKLPSTPMTSHSLSDGRRSPLSPTPTPTGFPSRLAGASALQPAPSAFPPPHFVSRLGGASARRDPDDYSE